MNQVQIIKIVNWAFATIVLTLGIMNILRGNDQLLGVALLFASTLYFPPTFNLLKDIKGVSVHYLLRLLVALLIIWVNLAVGAIGEGFYPEITG